jgi:hypothetical protein
MMLTLQILERATDQLGYIARTYVPLILAGLTIFLISYILAAGSRALLNRIFKGIAFDRFLSQSGLASILDGSGRLRATTLVANTAFWVILISGLLTALSAWNTEITSRIVASVVFMFPKLIATAAILVAGAWLAQYLGRSVLIWACNDGISQPRRWAAAVRTVIMFVAVVVAADYLNFARSVFLAAFIILVGGAVLAAALAIGLGARDAVRRQFDGGSAQTSSFESLERSLRNHL